MHDLIIIGGGPAALSAASYALGKQLTIALVYGTLGGRVGWRHSLADLDDERRLPGNEVVRLLTARTVHNVATHVQAHVLNVTRSDQGFIVTTDKHPPLRGAAVIVATGATALRLDVPNANRFVRHGLGYSIRTFGHLVAGKRVAVIGGTPRALRGAAELARLAAHVYVIAPAPVDSVQPLIAALQQQPNVSVMVGYDVTEVVGADRIVGLRVGKASETQLIEIDQAYADCGLIPQSDAVRDLVALDAHSFIIVDSYNATSMPGIFAAGDVTTLPCEQVLVAIGAGAQAAISAYDYLLARWLASDTVIRRGSTPEG